MDTSGSKCLEKGRGKISKMLKGKVLRACVTPSMPVWSGDSGINRTTTERVLHQACLYGLETVTLTEQQQKLQVWENDWVHRITRTKRADRRRMNDLRKEVQMQYSLTGRLVRNRMRWAATW